LLSCYWCLKYKLLIYKAHTFSRFPSSQSKKRPLPKNKQALIKLKEATQLIVNTCCIKWWWAYLVALSKRTWQESLHCIQIWEYPAKERGKKLKDSNKNAFHHYVELRLWKCTGLFSTKYIWNILKHKKSFKVFWFKKYLHNFQSISPSVES